MPPKRKRVTDHSDDDGQRDAKRLKTGPVITLPLLHSLPDDCLVEILGHLPPLSVCSALLVSKRFNSLFEALVLKDLSSRFESINKAVTVNTVAKKQLTDILYPRAQYTALNRLHSIDPEILEKQLCWLQRWFALKLTEQQNIRKLKTKSPELWNHLSGRFAFKDHSPATAFTTDEGSCEVEGGIYRVSFILFGQSGHFAEIECDVLSYHEAEENRYACKLSMNAKLLSCDSTVSTNVLDLLKGYKEANVPFLDDEKATYYHEPDEQSEQFQQELDGGDRVSCKWLGWKCVPKLNKKKLNQVIKWLGWTTSVLEMARILVGLSETLQSVRPTSCFEEDFEVNEESRNKYPDRSADEYYQSISRPADALNAAKPAIMNTTDTKAALNQLMSLALNEDDEQSLTQLVDTLGLLEAKIKLMNRIRQEWKAKDSAKLNQLTTLVDRSMFTKCTKMNCTYSRYSDAFDPNDKISVREVNGELKLFAEDPSKWLRIKFISHLEMPYDDGVYEGLYRYSLSTAMRQFPEGIIHNNPLMLRESDFELFKSELGLNNFSTEELNDLITLIADRPETLLPAE